MRYRDALIKIWRGKRREAVSAQWWYFRVALEGLPEELKLVQGAPVCRPGRQLAGLAFGVGGQDLVSRHVGAPPEPEREGFAVRW